MSWRGFVLYCLTNGVVLAVIIVLGFFTHYRLVNQAVERATSERDAHWKAEIAKSNLEAEIKLGAQAAAAHAADAAARDTIADAKLRIAELETKNDALPENVCGGLGRARVELLGLGRK